MSSSKKTSKPPNVKTEDPDDDFSCPAPQSSSAVVKQETESEDDFEEFPPGAIQFSRDQLFARMDARNHGLVTDQDETSRDSFDDFVAAPVVQHPAPPQHQDLLAESIIPEVERFLADREADNVSLTTTVTSTGQRTEIKFTLVKTPTKRNAETETEAQLNPESTQLPSSGNSFRRSRGAPSPDRQGSSRGEPKDSNTTPKKRAPMPDQNVTPSPAKRLRTLNLNTESSSEDEDTQDEQEEDTQDSEDTDPDYEPDTQDDKDHPADFRIPRNAPKDPLDLEY